MPDNRSVLVPMMRMALQRVVNEWALYGDIDEAVGEAQAILEQTQGLYDRAIESDYVPAEELVLMYQGGLSVYEIAEKLHLRAPSVYAALKRKGITFRKPGVSLKNTHKKRNLGRVKAMFEMRQTGATLEEIGAAFKITRERVRQLLLEEGYHIDRPLRPEELAAVDEYVKGANLWEAAQNHGLTLTKIKTLIKKAGHEIRPGPKNWRVHPSTIEKSKRAAKMYRAGHTNAEIAKALDMQPPSIYRLLAIAGVKPMREAGRTRRKNLRRKAEKQERIASAQRPAATA